MVKFILFLPILVTLWKDCLLQVFLGLKTFYRNGISINKSFGFQEKQKGLQAMLLTLFQHLLPFVRPLGSVGSPAKSWNGLSSEWCLVAYGEPGSKTVPVQDTNVTAKLSAWMSLAKDYPGILHNSYGFFLKKNWIGAQPEITIFTLLSVLQVQNTNKIFPLDW